ncbi:MAG: flagellin [Lachnospiraceae bacterium]|jgi:flagellar hook-associated protein 3 FlgL|nr:flagellin [Lachnospiraceae bacterium]MEE3460588.1 flagellin [Lachnospiraceae bacterium]
MRITNNMITANSQNHISNAKDSLLTADSQYASGKKIQRPSDDPTIAVRALRFRSTYSEMTQYIEKNVNDAMEWMDSTESAMKNVSSIMTNMKEKLNQGATDSYAPEERKDILASLQQFSNAIFQDQANADYAGRYLFTGYRTDTSLLFPEDHTNLAYDIKENFDYSDIDSVNKVIGGAQLQDTTDGQKYVDQTPQEKQVYRIQLAYKELSPNGLGEKDAEGNYSKMPDKETEANKNGGTSYVKVTLKDRDGKTVTGISTDPVKTYHSSYISDDGKTNAYDVGDDEMRFIYDTGEILVGKNLYEKIQSGQYSFTADYAKSSFRKNDIRPEMYFNCASYDSVTKKTINYADPSGQNINYEVNFSQTMNVNTQARDAFDTDIYRTIDYISQSVEDVTDLENKIEKAKTMINNETDAEKKSALNDYLDTLNVEYALKKRVMTEAFGKGLTMVDKTGDKLNEQVSILGSKYKRVKLTHDKLMDQQVDTKEKMSNNEDMEISDSYIALNEADNLYTASLSVTAKILQNSLLNYL